jgi:hypothetical protein
MVPSSARATAPSASPLPDQLVPLLQYAFEKIKSVIDSVLPVSKARTALEEAEWEDGGEEGALERELMLQCKLRTFFGKSLGMLTLSYSNGEAATLSPSRPSPRAVWDGPSICRGCSIASFGRLPCPNAGHL